MSNIPKVVAITKRTADLCATQSVLYSKGFELITATNMNVALSIINAMSVKGVIICRGSWSG